MSKKTLLDKGWKFVYGCETAKDAENSADLNNIKMPHTWNDKDGQDGGNNYRRGKGWYCLELKINKKSDKRYWLEFFGVNSVCNVYVNSVHLGEHRGGYTLFRFDATKALKKGKNTIVVCADNSPFADVIPLTADFTFFGGIYREVYLVESEAIHFDLDDFGSDGVKLSYENSPSVKDCAVLNIEANVIGADKDCKVIVQAYEPNCFEQCDGINKPDFNLSKMISDSNEPIAQTECSHGSNGFHGKLLISHPHLWDGRKEPFRYKIVCTIYKNNKEYDKVEKFVGFRWFSIHTQKGFFLNGRSYPLRGVNRHQDRKDMGWAITEKEHDEDFSLIYEMGANAIRLAHYPHHPHFYELCDRYGLLVWAEIPFVDCVGGIGKSGLPTDKKPNDRVAQNFIENAKQQMTELIYQQQHRPSIFCWSMSNEVMKKCDPSASFIMNILNELVHILDPERYSAIATNHIGSYNWKADIRACNIYPGWYFAKPEHFKYQYNYHFQANKLKGVGVSEYGAGANIFHHTENPAQPKDTKCAFHSEEWACTVHEQALKFLMKKSSNKVWGSFVWNMFDFAVDSRDEGELPGLNDKGLVTYDRKIKKDPFYLYKSYWSNSPVVYITSRRFEKRENRVISVKVYSNAPAVSLYVNGDKIKTLKNENNKQSHIFIFKKVELADGENNVTAKIFGDEDNVKWVY